MDLFKEPKIDCHAHVFDPVKFPYGKDIEYKPAGQEMGTPGQYAQVMKTYGVGYALLVQPNSGYGSDNRCLLDTIAKDKGRLKGIAIFDLDADIATLRDLKQQGIVGAAFNPTFSILRPRTIPTNDPEMKKNPSAAVTHTAFFSALALDSATTQ